jgi:2'-5' RNA ligase
MAKEEKYIRCFIALELDREIINYLDDLDLQIKKKNLFTGSFTDPENLHLTLKFLGEIKESKVEEVKKKLHEIKFQEFEASLGELGTFINMYNSILWIKLQGKEVWALQKLIDEKLKGLFEPEARFMSHITLARMKKIHHKGEFLDYVKNIRTKKIKFVVRDFVLKKSELRPEGPVYNNIEVYDLEDELNPSA